MNEIEFVPRKDDPAVYADEKASHFKGKRLEITLFRAWLDSQKVTTQPGVRTLTCGDDEENDDVRLELQEKLDMSDIEGKELIRQFKQQN